MPIMSRDPEKAAAKEEARRQREEERTQQAQQAAQQQREAAFWASPAGQARAAWKAGSRYYQVALPLSVTQRTFAGFVSGDKTTATRDVDPTDLLGAIESEGWTLWNASYVFRETGSVSRDKLLSSGQTAATVGEIVGIYLFRKGDVLRRPD
jgi:hypothetical protein